MKKVLLLFIIAIFSQKYLAMDAPYKGEKSKPKTVTKQQFQKISKESTKQQILKRAKINQILNEEPDYTGYKIITKNAEDLNRRSNDTIGDTILIFAAGKDDLELVELLLDVGADIALENNESDTALMRAAIQGRYEVVALLLAKGADVNQKSSQGQWNAFMGAANNDHIEVMKLLLKAGAHINAQNSDGDTALILAVREGYAQIVKWLLEQGAFTHLTNRQNQTALDIAQAAGNQEIVKLLLEYQKKKL